MAEKTATWGIRVQTDTNAQTSAASVKDLKAQVEASQAAVKNYAEALRSLTGKSKEVVDARAQLKTAITAEKEAISRVTLEIGKHGTTLGEARKQTQSTGQGMLALSGSFAIADIAVKVVTASISIAVDVLKTFGDAAISLVKFAVTSADSLRTMNLMREAALGTAENARAMGTQIEALRHVVPLSTEKLQEMSLELGKLFVGTRVTGQGIVDTMNASAQATAAFGDSAGKAVQGIIDRGKQFGRTGIGLNELQGTGLNFDTVTAALAKHLNTSFGQAQLLLRTYRVNVNDAAAALRSAIEKQVGGINQSRLVSLDAIMTRLHDNFRQLASSFNVKPILDQLSKFVSLFDQSTVTGEGFKGVLTGLGAALNVVFGGDSVSSVRDFFDTVILAMLRLENRFLENRNAVEDWVAGLKGNFESLKPSTSELNSLIEAVALSVKFLGGVATFTAISIRSFLDEVRNLNNLLHGTAIGVRDKAATIPRSFEGEGAGPRQIVSGVTSALKAGKSEVKAASSDMAAASKEGFDSKLEIRSPSKAFERSGRAIAQGVAQGVDAESGTAESAVNNVISFPSRGAGAGINANANASGGALNGANVTVTVNVSFPNVKDGKEAAETLNSQSFLAQLTKAFEDIARSSGAPVNAPQTATG